MRLLTYKGWGGNRLEMCGGEYISLYSFNCFNFYLLKNEKNSMGNKAKYNKIKNEPNYILSSHHNQTKGENKVIKLLLNTEFCL